VSTRSLLTTVLVAAQLPADVPEARMLRGWLDSWAGVREVIDTMNGHGYDVRLSQSPFGWRAEFSRSDLAQIPSWIGQAVVRAVAGGPAHRAGHPRAHQGLPVPPFPGKLRDWSWDRLLELRSAVG
jgi:hypothetical protein